MNNVPKFSRGNIVVLLDAEHEGAAVILDHNEINEGCLNNRFTYGIKFQDGSNLAWIKEDYLTLVDKGGEHVINEYSKGIYHEN